MEKVCMLVPLQKMWEAFEVMEFIIIVIIIIIITIIIFIIIIGSCNSERDLWGGLVVDGRTILQWTLKR